MVSHLTREKQDSNALHRILKPMLSPPTLFCAQKVLIYVGICHAADDTPEFAVFFLSI